MKDQLSDISFFLVLYALANGVFILSVLFGKFFEEIEVDMMHIFATMFIYTILVALYYLGKKSKAIAVLFGPFFIVLHCLYFSFMVLNSQHEYENDEGNYL